MTRDAPIAGTAAVPRHVAVIMDGNGRWAQLRDRPRAMGHRAGVKSVRQVVRAAAKARIEVLTLFAFSQENWKRPELEVSLLMQLFIATLGREVRTLHKNGIRIRFIGQHDDFQPQLRDEMRRAEALTADNQGMVLVIAVGYGGHWDIAQAAQQLATKGQAITPEAIESHLVTADLPLPDLLIRTGGEQRISNFLMWQLAYTELHFSDVLWPDYDEAAFHAALTWYAGRERRYGRVPEAA